MSTRGALPDSGRLITFLDAAVAIALTLLVLPLVDRVPEAVRSGEGPAELLAANAGAFGSFLLSFVVIWRFWTVHHRTFASPGPIGPWLLRLNLLWLLSLVTLPFVTEMVASYGDDPLVLRLYVGLLLVTGASSTAMVVLMRRDRGQPEEAFLVGSVAVCVGLAVAFTVVLIAPSAGYWSLLVLLLDPLTTPIVARLRRRVTAGAPTDG